MSWRSERIAEQVRAELATLLREEVSDPRVGLVNLNHVKVAPDLSTAVVAWSAFEGPGQPDLDDIAEGLQSAAGFLRRRLAANLQLRKTPELKFRYDPSIEQGARTLSILKAIRDGEKA